MREELRAALAARPRATLGAATAAVLVLLDGERVVLTLRSAGLRAHGGQWSFPGGRIDPGDADPTATALREAEEEIGVPRAAVEVLGWLSDVRTSSEHIVVPVVGWLSARRAWVPNPVEVAEILEAPVTRLTDPEALTRNEVLRDGVPRTIYSYAIEGRTVWGATARILFELASLLSG